MRSKQAKARSKAYNLYKQPAGVGQHRQRPGLHPKECVCCNCFFLAITASTQTSDLEIVQRLQSTLRGAVDAIFDLVCSRITLEQWVEWLRTQLEHAVAAGNVDLSAKLEAAGRARAKAVHPAVRGGRETLVNELLRLGASPAEPDENSDTPLHVAVQAGRVDVLSLLLRKGAAVNTLGKEGRSPLQLAAGAEGAGSLDLVQRLVSTGDVDLSLCHGKDGKSALDWATFHGVWMWCDL